MNNSPIGIFDSGVGGLSVVKEIINILPNENLIYLGDTARVPYGTRDPETIRKFSDELVRFMQKHHVKAIVVACNTMSAVALKEIKSLAKNIPVIDVISPTVLLAVAHTHTNILSVVGTRATANSRAYQAQISRHGKQFQTISKACPLFVPLVEEGLLTGNATELIAKDYLEEINKSSADVLILGCTHYPLLLPTIKKVLRRRIKIIDSALPTAEKLKNVLEKNNLLNSSRDLPIRKFYVTDNPARSFEIANIFFDNKFPGKIVKVNI